MTQKILFAVDGSDCSAQAADALVAHIKHFRQPPQVHLLYVHLPVPLESATRHVTPDTLTRYYRDEGEAQLARAAALLSDAGVTFTPHIHVGDPADTLIRMAHELGCDFICMGTHGRGAASGAMLGSVSAKVIRRTDLPVLFARHPG